MLHDILGLDHIQWHSPLISHFTLSWPWYLAYYRFDVITLFHELSIGRLQRVRLANRGRLLLRTPGHVPFGTCICSNVETIPSWTCYIYGTFEFRTSLGTSILLHLYYLSLAVWHAKKARLTKYKILVHSGSRSHYHLLARLALSSTTTLRRKRKGRRFDAVVWETPLNDRPWIGKETRRRYNNVRLD